MGPECGHHATYTFYKAVKYRDKVNINKCDNDDDAGDHDDDDEDHDDDDHESQVITMTTMKSGKAIYYWPLSG